METPCTPTVHETITVVDFGSQFSHLIARRLREVNVFSRIVSYKAPLSEITPPECVGVILSGGPSSVYDADAPHICSAQLLDGSVPVLGICYGMQEIAFHLKGKVEGGRTREFGFAQLELEGEGVADCPLFKDVPQDSQVWMSHGDSVTILPPDFSRVGKTSSCVTAAMACATKRIYGLQFHPEVTHSAFGAQILRNFALEVCSCSGDWKMRSFVDEAVARVREAVGPSGTVIGAVSGGVDSTVAAALVHRAIGDRFVGVFVDTGMLRHDEGQQVFERLSKGLGMNLRMVNAEEEFLTALEGVSDPEQKRKIIGKKFIDVFERESTKPLIVSRNNNNYNEEENNDGSNVSNDPSSSSSVTLPSPSFLLQGTLYPDVIESISHHGPSVTIKSHHNVGGLPSHMKLHLLEPLRLLFKDEVRQLGRELKIADEHLFRHPFPGPGLAIRVIGAIDRASLDMLRHADHIFIEELIKADYYSKVGQAFVVLLPCKSVGVMGDGRTYEQVCVLRAVTTTDFMTADWADLPFPLLRRVSGRIINEVKGINRVTYDVSSKPPSTIEWE